MTAGPGKASQTPAQAERCVDANAVVSYNLRAIRERRGWTQQAVADKLGRLTGRQIPQQSISSLEAGLDGRRRRFDAHQLYLLSQVFDVPIVFFFVPPGEREAPGRTLAHTGGPLHLLYGAFLGRLSQLQALDERLEELQGDDEGRTEAVISALFGTSGGVRRWPDHYRSWRQARTHDVDEAWAERLLDAAAVVSGFVREVRNLGPEAVLDEDGGTARATPGPRATSGACWRSSSLPPADGASAGEAEPT